ncbi:MBOAT family O-acyltransferase [Janthinobacterium sp. LB2P49]|uniref:MBOAT family O-acyltransferase n=1 Tax=Janthinobacterium sp. LB2P49 TaxID=3424198 RepID=UPI003F237E97
MVWLSTFGMLCMPILIALYWRLPSAWRPYLLASCGGVLLCHDGWASVAAWGALLAWLALISGPQWKRPALMQTVGLAGVLLAFIAYQYAKASHGLLAYLGYAFVSLKVWHLIAEHGSGIVREGRASLTAGYLLFPPTVTVGPIQRYDTFRLELLRARWDNDIAAQALQRMLYGYCKIVLLAGYLLTSRLNGLNLSTGSAPLDAYLGLVGYGLNLYWQFSGYCDIAIGFAALLGIRVPENFHFPFAARSLPDFWRRWHITVSEWCRDFVFRPILTHTRQYLFASLASMMVLGLWHELSPRYLAWGLFHGAGLAFVHLWTKYLPWTEALRRYRLWRVTCWFVTLQFVTLSFVFTSTPDLPAAWSCLTVLFAPLLPGS